VRTISDRAPLYAFLALASAALILLGVLSGYPAAKALLARLEAL
jgi:hypothetical protein